MMAWNRGAGALRLKYEPKTDERGRKIKHKWDKPYPDFIEHPTGLIEGKCPNTISMDIAQELLNDGIRANPNEWEKQHPKWVFNIHNGVVYKAVATNSGQLSYHAFPCRGPRSKDMSARTMKKLLAKAQEKKCYDAIEKWFKEHP